MVEQALSDFKVVELCDFISGPYCTKMFADMGAEVIKVEPPGTGDITRKLGPFSGDVPNPEKSGQFLYLNANKLGITLDIKSATGRKILKELISQADVFVESKPRQMMEELELDYESLKKLNPQLVMTSITPWGHTGPYRDYKGYDISIGAGGGEMWKQGDPDREPLQLPAYLGSYYSAECAAAATMCALYTRDIGGPAQHVDISEIRCWATTMAIGYVTQFLDGQVSVVRTATKMPLRIFPFHQVRCKDGIVGVAAPAEDMWAAILDVMGNPEWSKDPRFKAREVGHGGMERAEHAEELSALMDPWFMSHTKVEILKLAIEKNAFRGMYPLLSLNEFIESEQLEEREWFIELDHPQAGKLKYPGAPYKLSETAARVGQPAPLLGQHNEEVYCHRLGYTKEDLVRLQASSII